MKDKLRLVAIIRNIEPSNILAIAQTLINEGIRSIEVSLSEAEKGFGCLEILRSRYCEEELFLGAGTVTKTDEVDRLSSLGIRFFFTPGFDGAVVDYALKRDILVVPGVLTPSDVQQATARGLTMLKLFPANAFPIKYIKDLKGPFPRTQYLAVGGVNPDNLQEFFAAGFFGAALGSALVPQGSGSEQLDAIRATAHKCMLAVKQAEKGV